MNRKFLEGLGLEKETIDKIMAEHGSTVETQKKSFEGVIATKDTEIANRDELLKTAGKTIKEFESVDVKDLQGKVKKYEDDLKAAQIGYAADLKATQDAHTAALHTINFNSVLEKSLSGVKAKNVKAVKALLDTDGLKLDGDKIIGFDDIIKPVMEANPFLFESEQQQNQQQEAQGPFVAPTQATYPHGAVGEEFNFNFSPIRPMPKKE